MASNQTIHFRTWAGYVATTLCSAGRRGPATTSPNTKKVNCPGCKAAMASASAPQ
jgi:hypothetical protein